MTNRKRQEWLDKQKWLLGENIKEDPSGSMCYCDFCKYQREGQCDAFQRERVKEAICAKAYNKMFKEKKNGTESN